MNLFADFDMCVGGSYLTDPQERDEAVCFLEDMEKITGWRTKHVIEDMRAKWAQSIS